MLRSNYESKKGIYQLRNPRKYIGSLTDDGVLFRSSWEERMYYYMDHNRNVIEWSVESVIVPYLFTLDGKVHKYYPDIICKVQSDKGIKTYMLEVKPSKQTQEPTKPKNRSLDRKKRYEKEMFVYAKNRDKWKAANKYCNEHGLEFMLITEKHIFGK